VLEGIIADHGKDAKKWPQALQDLFDPTVPALSLAPPQAGRVKTHKNPNVHCHWAKDLCGEHADHSRVEGLKAVGWDFATTADVDMANEFVVKNRNGKGFSNEIRNGDLRLMKVPMMLWRQHEKAHLINSYQMTYPQAYGVTGKAMKAQDVAPGLRNEIITDPDELAAFESRFRPENTSVAKTPKLEE